MTSDRKYLWVVHAQSDYEPRRVSYFPTQKLEHLKNEARKVFPKLEDISNDQLCFLEGATILKNSDRCEKYQLGNSTTFPLILTLKIEESYMPLHWLIKLLPETEKGVIRTDHVLCCCDFLSKNNQDEDSESLIDTSLQKEIPMKGVINSEFV